MTDRIRSLEFDLNHVTEMRDLCKHGIENGNWVGYSEHLIVRKQRLKEHNAEIERIKKEIESLTHPIGQISLF